VSAARASSCRSGRRRRRSSRCRPAPAVGRSCVRLTAERCRVWRDCCLSARWSSLRQHNGQSGPSAVGEKRGREAVADGVHFLAACRECTPIETAPLQQRMLRKSLHVEGARVSHCLRSLAVIALSMPFGQPLPHSGNMFFRSSVARKSANTRIRALSRLWAWRRTQSSAQCSAGTSNARTSVLSRSHK
jgi:hypothetical protein